MRMDYISFKEAFADKFLGYLPEAYADWEGVDGRVPKVNGYADAYHLIKRDTECASPTLYFHDLYKDYLRCGSVEEVCRRAAAFVHAMEYVERAQSCTIMAEPLENVVYQLVSGEKNEELLNHVPHRRIMDLAIIYRVFCKCPGDGFNSAMITHEHLRDVGAENEQMLYDAAVRNTPRLLPVQIHEIGLGMHVLTNRYRALGAAAMLYPGILRQLAEDAGGDLILLPSSVHEFFVTPYTFEHPEGLKEIVEEANSVFCGREDFLSDSIYLYRRETDKVERLA